MNFALLGHQLCDKEIRTRGVWAVGKEAWLTGVVPDGGADVASEPGLGASDHSYFLGFRDREMGTGTCREMRDTAHQRRKVSDVIYHLASSPG